MSIYVHDGSDETGATNKRQGRSNMNILTRFLKDESGATAIEYGLIAALISVGIVAGVTSMGSSLQSVFTKLGGKLDAAVK